MHVHVVGNACIDTTFRLGRFPAAGETLNAVAYSDGLGGKGANQAVAAARTGAAVMLWTALGEDPVGAWIRSRLDMELSDVRVSEFELPSDRSSIVIDAGGENFIVSGVACSEAFDPIAQTTLAHRITPGDILVCQGNLRRAATNTCLRAARENGARTILNASPIDEAAMPDFGLADMLVVNQSEAKALTGQTDMALAAGALTAKGAGKVVITLGAKGCLVLGPDQAGTLHLPAPHVEAIDTSGAGDVFCGCLAGGLAKGMPVTSALKFALAAAAISVTRPGTLLSCPSASEMAALVDQTEFS
ncbi:MULTISPECIES: PfkB family carbohydrate kinase [unclassified Mesorhizobium]|uniref:PfkB family carbohydrate kinase n=1 Tax=unclassified Mesorhizobium TaxID=325217 RepID=UPI00112B6493|nr:MULTISPECIES: PfkB family carbohydrate kinase [unclassified Mesorhizobium]MBZ9701785.1 PfkB family carbohydrate kinase [Mesorhizobium sp. CO1-1-3]MBZ9949133.1 PfkB family carbohydrate kinase [Mesorhizobium sp. BR1-1-11]TPI99664.1 ribokinase [Mesorhizobium sp. B2-8-1]